MRLAAITLTVLVLATPSLAQPFPCTPDSAALAFDPYKPSELAIARNYGGTVLAQAPLGELLQLDPYVPIEGELLRQLGRAIPVWAYTGHAWHLPVPQSSPCVAVHQTALLQPAGTIEPPLTTLTETLAVLAPRAAAAPAGPTRIASERTPGITIEWDGRIWVSAGPAVPFRDTEFVRIGERAQSPIFQRAGAKDNVIYIRSTPGMVAPFRTSR